MASNLTALTWLRSEWDKVQTSGTEGGYYGENRMRISYDEYLKNAGFKSEAEAIAKRAEEEASGLKFGEQKTPDEIAQLAERTDTPAYLAELDAAQARARAEDAKRIALLSRGTITGQEPVYIIGTPENLDYMLNKAPRGPWGAPIQPSAYQDAQAFAARYMAYDRLGGNDPTSTVFDASINQWIKVPNPFYNEKVMVPKVGMGTTYEGLERAIWAAGTTEERDVAQYNIDAYFSSTVGGNPVGQRFFMRTPGDISNTGVGTPTPTGTTGTTTGTTIPRTSGTQLTNFVATDGTKFTTQDAFTTYQANLNKTAADTRSAIQIVTDRFNKYGLGSLAPKIQELGVLGATEATITLALQDTPEYQARFSANQNRLKQGLTVLSPAEYLSVEDGYRQVLRAYGLKQFDTDAYVQQFISNNTSPGEFSNRVVTAVQRVQNADPAIIKQLRDYYGIGSADMVAYVLDPEQQFEKIKLQVAASEIGVMAGRQGLTAGVDVAEQLVKQGVTQAEAQKGYSTIADILPTAEKLSDIYGKTTGTTYGQSEAEQEVFNSLASAQRKRQQLTALEVASFSGQSGLSKAALSTQNKGNF